MSALQRKPCVKKIKRVDKSPSPTPIPDLVESPLEEIEKGMSALQRKPCVKKIKRVAKSPSPTPIPDLVESPLEEIEKGMSPLQRKPCVKKIKRVAKSPTPTPIPDLVESPLEEIEERKYTRQRETRSVSLPPRIKIDMASPEDPTIENLPKLISDIHLGAPPRLGKAAAVVVEAVASTSSATTAVDASAPDQDDMKKQPSTTEPQRATGIFSLKNSPADPKTYPVWYLKTLHQDLFQANRRFQGIRDSLTPPVVKTTFSSPYDDNYRRRYKRNSEPSEDQNCCCARAVAEILCKRCRKLLKRRRRDSMSSQTRTLAPEHPRALFAVRPLGSPSSPVVNINITPRRFRCKGYVIRTHDPRYRFRSQSCYF